MGRFIKNIILAILNFNIQKIFITIKETIKGIFDAFCQNNLSI